MSGKIGLIYETQTIQSKNGGNPIVKREFVIRALRFNPDDGTPELSERNTPVIELQGEERVGILDNFKVGDFVKVYFVVEGRGVKNQDNTYKFFNSVRATRIEKLDIKLDEPQKASQQNASAAQPAVPAEHPQATTQTGTDNLPF